jgi:hypothetical protein
MAHPHHDPRTRQVPAEDQEFAKRLVQERGPRAAAALLGLSRTSLASVVAGFDVTPGTLALLELARLKRSAA